MKAWKRPTSTGGVALPMRISVGESGVTSSWSNVPCSRSFAIERPARNMTCTKAIIARNDGRKVQRESWFGLHQVRVSIVTVSCAQPPAALQSAAMCAL